MSKRADTLGNHPIKPRSLIVIAPYLLHRHQCLWDRPDIFDPARFLPPAKANIPRFAYALWRRSADLHRFIVRAAGSHHRPGRAGAAV
jgi:cytochrome P450